MVQILNVWRPKKTKGTKSKADELGPRLEFNRGVETVRKSRVKVTLPTLSVTKKRDNE